MAHALKPRRFLYKAPTGAVRQLVESVAQAEASGHPAALPLRLLRPANRSLLALAGLVAIVCWAFVRKDSR